MSKVRSVRIRCLHCGKWFDSGIQFGDDRSFSTSTLEGNLQQCPRCHKMTGCNKENMDVVTVDDKGKPDGGFVGKDTV